MVLFKLGSPEGYSIFFFFIFFFYFGIFAITDRMRPRTEPWGTPQVRLHSAEKDLLAETFCDWSNNQDETQERADSCIPAIDCKPFNRRE